MKTIIALAGPKGIGKTTTARAIQDYLCSRGMESVEITSLARPIKTAIAAMGIEAYDKEATVYGQWTLRNLYVSLGQTWGRETIGRDFWLDLLCQHLDRCPKKIVIIDDLRMQNEYARLTSAYGAATFVLQRQGITYTMENPTEQGIVGGHQMPTDTFDMPAIATSILHAAGVCNAAGEIYAEFL